MLACLLAGRVFTSAQSAQTEAQAPAAKASVETSSDPKPLADVSAEAMAAATRAREAKEAATKAAEEATAAFERAKTARDAFVGVTTTNTYQPIEPKYVDGRAVKADPICVTPIPDEIYESFGLDRHYKKMIKINGITVFGSQRVSDYALLEAAYTKDHTFRNSPKWVRDMFEPLKIRLNVISVVEFTMDLPENNRGGRNSELADGLFQDNRSRGLGGLPNASCGEENLLNLRGDRYGGRDGLQGQGENIVIHEFAHTTASAIQRVQGRDGPFWTKLRAALAAARFEGNDTKPAGRIFAWNRDHGRNGQPINVYGGSNEQEYWAEGAQAWFNNANPSNSGGISTREDVKEKDPPLAALLAEVYGDGEWRYIKTTATNPDGTPMRPAAELAHLAGIDRSKIPVFNNNHSPRVLAAAADPALSRGRRGGGGGGGGGRGRRGGGEGRGGEGARGTGAAANTLINETIGGDRRGEGGRSGGGG
jgi:alpha-glucosidase